MARFSEVKKKLKDHKLRITDGRVDILDFFMRENRTMSMRDLENEFISSDRVTLYRTLSSFTKNGLLHKIPNESGHATYGLCQDTCDSEEHNHDHMHFKCDECGTLECLEQNVPRVEVPGYHIKEANLILKGTCKLCVA